MTRLLITVTLLFSMCVSLSAEESGLKPLFVVETDEETASESLERISGQIDLGFSKPSQNYVSPSHYAPGPMGRQKTVEENTER